MNRFATLMAELAKLLERGEFVVWTWGPQDPPPQWSACVVHSNVGFIDGSPLSAAGDNGEAALTQLLELARVRAEGGVEALLKERERRASNRITAATIAAPTGSRHMAKTTKKAAAPKKPAAPKKRSGKAESQVTAAQDPHAFELCSVCEAKNPPGFTWCFHCRSVPHRAAAGG